MTKQNVTRAMSMIHVYRLCETLTYYAVVSISEQLCLICLCISLYGPANIHWIGIKPYKLSCSLAKCESEWLSSAKSWHKPLPVQWTPSNSVIIFQFNILSRMAFALRFKSLYISLYSRDTFESFHVCAHDGNTYKHTILCRTSNS